MIDPVKGEVIKTIDLGGEPEQAVSDGAGMIYDNLASTNEIVAIDTKALTVKAALPGRPGPARGPPSPWTARRGGSLSADASPPRWS